MGGSVGWMVAAECRKNLNETFQRISDWGSWELILFFVAEPLSFREICTCDRLLESYQIPLQVKSY